nr:AAA family ATPase [Desulfobulbus rhabdoformis]
MALSLHNLNSLAGTWSIDFTATEYATTGIFAITGPTGAGKSTLLDALCLALYGRTPRLGPITKGSNEIMSRRAGECFAEVSFSTNTGSFRCHWGQHRARRKAQGELQTPRHELAELETGKILESRSRQVVRLVEELTGMDYDRFTRSILLAQGDFAAFLQADADQRAPLLEQITGTSIYSQLSIAVHERTSEERRRLKTLQEGLGALQLLSPEEKDELATSIAEQSKTVEEVRAKLALVDKNLQQQEQLAKLGLQLQENENKRIHLAKQREQREPEFKQLALGHKAQPLIPLYTSLSQLSKQISSLEKRQAQRTENTVRLEKTRQHQQKELSQALEALTQIRERREHELELIKEVRALDLHLHEKQKANDQILTTLQQHNKELAAISAAEKGMLEQQAVLRKQQQTLDHFFEERSPDAQLVEEFAGLRQQLLHLARQEETREQYKQTLRALEKEQKNAHVLHEKSTKRFAQVEKDVHQCLQEQKKGSQKRDTLLDGRELSWLREQLADRTALIARLQQGLERAEEWQILQKKTRELDEQTTTLNAQRKKLQEQETQLAGELQLRQDLVLQYEKNHRLQLRIRSYEQERDHLQEGSPCPLCGSPHHPWGHGSAPLEDSESELNQARSLLEESQKKMASHREGLAVLGRDLDHLRQSTEETQKRLAERAAQLVPLLAAQSLGPVDECRQAIATQLTNVEEQQAALCTQIKHVEQVENRLQKIAGRLEQVNALHTKYSQEAQANQERLAAKTYEVQSQTTQLAEADRLLAQTREELRTVLAAYGGIDLNTHKADELITALEARRQRWKKRLAQQEELTRQEIQLAGELEKQALQASYLKEQIQQQRQKQQSLAEERQGLTQRRRELYGSKDPNREEQQLRQGVQAAEKNEGKIRQQLAQSEKELHGLSQQQQLDNEELASIGPQKSQQETKLRQQVAAAGFADLDAFQDAILPLETLQALELKKQQLDQEETLLAAGHKELQAAIAQVEEQVAKSPDKEELEQEKQQLVKAQEGLQQAIGGAQERLRANEQRAQSFQQQQEALEKQRQELDRFEVLHQLIGSADGKKFRVFAQGLTFEVMVSHANRQLQKMSDRYILLRDPERPLSLQVIDNYQAGEIRSTRNLSGGESFLVSLALSLGLSAMASHNVRVDSLFLDEGFGTLDEETLDTALQTLASLQQDGKLIGIISHVSLLQERIDLRIEVQPGPDGCSRLMGPGCHQIT